MPVGQPYFSYRPVRLHRLAESIPRNQFLGSIDVYKYGLCTLYITGKQTVYTVTVYCMYDAIEKQRILQGYNGITYNTYNSRHTNLRLSENNFKTIKPDQAKECNYYSTVLPLSPEGD